MKYITIVFFLLLFCFSTNAQNIISQSVIGNAGEYLESGVYKINFTIGETVIETVSNSNNVLTQGFHQTDLMVVSVNDPAFSEGEVSLFPNPTEDLLFINLTFDQKRNITVALYDPLGRMLKQNSYTINAEQLKLDLSSYAIGNYTVVITDEQSQIKQSFKIIKS